MSKKICFEEEEQTEVFESLSEAQEFAKRLLRRGSFSEVIEDLNQEQRERGN